MIKTKNTYAFLYHWHQRIGLFMCIAVIAWALSGLAHPIISRLNPKPAAPPPQEFLNLERLADFSQLVRAQDIQQIEQLRLFQWQGQGVYRIASERGVEYFSAETLAPIEAGDFVYAEYLARHFLGDTDAAVGNLQLVREFNREYLYINRYLPVIRVDYVRDDQPRVYIDPALGRLATIDNERKVLTGKFFRTLHSWTWIESLPLRRSLMTVFLVLGFTTAAFGLTVYIKSWRLGMFRKSLSAHQHHARTRRLHRSLGAFVALFAMTFCASGLLHLWLTDKTDAPQTQLPQMISTTNLQLDTVSLAALLHHESIEDIQLTQFGDQTYWRIKKHQKKTFPEAEHHHGAAGTSANSDGVIYVNAHTGDQVADGWQEHAKYLALALRPYPATTISGVEVIDKFSGEYGFINKRLPVHAVHFDLPGRPTVYVETASNTLASEVLDSKRVEGYSFAYLHKWHFADFLGKDLRDLLAGSMALLILLVLLLGAFRFLKGGRKHTSQR